MNRIDAVCNSLRSDDGFSGCASGIGCGIYASRAGLSSSTLERAQFDRCIALRNRIDGAAESLGLVRAEGGRNFTLESNLAKLTEIDFPQVLVPKRKRSKRNPTAGVVKVVRLFSNAAGPLKLIHSVHAAHKHGQMLQSVNSTVHDRLSTLVAGQAEIKNAIVVHATKTNGHLEKVFAQTQFINGRIARSERISRNDQTLVSTQFICLHICIGFPRNQYSGKYSGKKEQLGRISTHL